MQKIWGYLSAFLGGIIAGLVLMYKLSGEQIKVIVRKIKTKRNSGDTNTVIPISVEKKRNNKDKVADSKGGGLFNRIRNRRQNK